MSGPWQDPGALALRGSLAAPSGPSPLAAADPSCCAVLRGPSGVLGCGTGDRLVPLRAGGDGGTGLTPLHTIPRCEGTTAAELG